MPQSRKRRPARDAMDAPRTPHVGDSAEVLHAFAAFLWHRTVPTLPMDLGRGSPPNFDVEQLGWVARRGSLPDGVVRPAPHRRATARAAAFSGSNSRTTSSASAVR